MIIMITKSAAGGQATDQTDNFSMLNGPFISWTFVGEHVAPNPLPKAVHAMAYAWNPTSIALIMVSIRKPQEVPKRARNPRIIKAKSCS